MHGGATPASKRKARETAALKAAQTEMKRYARAIDAGDAEADSAASLEGERLRTLGWIRFCEDQIANLTEAELIFGLSAQELVTGTQNGRPVELRKVVESSRVHPWARLLIENREHLVKLLGIEFAHNVEQRRLDQATYAVDQMQRAVDIAVEALGHNPRDPAVRAKLAAALANAAG